MLKETKVKFPKKESDRIKSIQKNILLWGQSNYRGFSWRFNRTPYSVFVSEILLKRTTATAVEKIFDEFIEKYPNLESLAKADKEKMRNLLLRIGYHLLRTEILVKSSRFIIKEYQGKIPNTRNELLAIPHVGPYTANAILSLSYEIPVPMVDSNVQRIIKRVFFVKSERKILQKKIYRCAEALLPKQKHKEFNFALLDFGALICRYVNPKCHLCSINRFCNYYLIQEKSS